MSSKQPALATPESVEEILGIGRERQPQEACGVILPRDRVFELPNVSEDPTGSYAIDTQDLLNLLGRTEGIPPDIERHQIIIWHTHPDGNVGPSSRDMQTKAEGFQYLVVALPNGKATHF